MIGLGYYRVLAFTALFCFIVCVVYYFKTDKKRTNWLEKFIARIILLTLCLGCLLVVYIGIGREIQSRLRSSSGMCGTCEQVPVSWRPVTVAK
jgi:hypothetical protein